MINNAIEFLAFSFDTLAAWFRYARPAILALLIAAAIPVGLFAGCRAIKLVVPKTAQVSP